MSEPSNAALMPAPARVRQVLAERFEINPTALTEAAGGAVTALANGRYRVKAKGQHCGVVNRNNRIYPAESTWGKHTREDAPFIARVRSRRVVGQLEHPADGKSSMGLAAVVITEVSAPNDKGEVFVTFETMSTPAGMVVASHIRDGVGFGISSRGNGSVQRNREGVDEVQPDFEPVTFDLVCDESTPGAEVVAVKLKECRQRLLEAAGGDATKACALAEAQGQVAIERDQIAEQDDKPPTTHNEFLLSLPDGSGCYRAYDNGLNQWDVWLEIHALPPQRLAVGLQTVKDAKMAAENHMRTVVGEAVLSDPKARGVVNAALKAKRVTEDAEVDAAMPYSGTMLTLDCGSETEADTAVKALEAAGFHCGRVGSTEVQVYTTIENGDQALAQVQRVLADKDLDLTTEAVAFIRKGKIVWEGKRMAATTSGKPVVEGSRMRERVREMVKKAMSELSGTVPGDMDDMATTTPQEDGEEDGIDYFDAEPDDADDLGVDDLGGDDHEEPDADDFGGEPDLDADDIDLLGTESDDVSTAQSAGLAGADGMGDVSPDAPVGEDGEYYPPPPVEGDDADADDADDTPEARLREMVREVMAEMGLDPADATAGPNVAESGYPAPTPLDDPEDLDHDLMYQDAPKDTQQAGYESRKRKAAEARKKAEAKVRESQKKHEAHLRENKGRPIQGCGFCKPLIEAEKDDDEKDDKEKDDKADKEKAEKRKRKNESDGRSYYRMMPLLGPRGTVAGSYRLWFNQKDALVEVETFDAKGKRRGSRTSAALTEKNRATLSLAFATASKTGKLTEKRQPKAKPAAIPESKRQTSAAQIEEAVFATLKRALGEKKRKAEEKHKAKKADEKKAKGKDEATGANPRVTFLQGEVTRLERALAEMKAEVAKRDELIEAMAEMQRAQAIESKLTDLVTRNPELARVRERLARCESVEALDREAGVMLGLVESARAPAAPAGAVIAFPAPAKTHANGNGSGPRAVSVASGKTEGAPTGPLSEDAHAGSLLGGLKDNGASFNGDDTAGRTAAYRRRQRGRA